MWECECEATGERNRTILLQMYAFKWNYRYHSTVPHIAKPKTYTQNELNGLWFFLLWLLRYEITATQAILS